MRGHEGREDGGNVVILLEVILVGVIVLVTALTINSFHRDPGSSANAVVRDSLTSRTHRILEVLDALPPYNLTTQEMDAVLGGSFLERQVREMFVDNASARWQWNSVKRSLLDGDSGVRAQLGYSIAGEYVPLVGDPLRDGERVGESIITVPKWNAGYAWPATKPVTATTPLEVEAMFVNRSLVPRQPGEAVRMTAWTDASDAPVEVWGLAGQEAVSAPSASLSWTMIADDPVAGVLVSDVSTAEVDHGVQFELKITTSQALPASTRIRVRLEPGFEDFAVDGLFTQQGVRLKDGSREHVIAPPTSGISAGVTPLSFRANPYPATYDACPTPPLGCVVGGVVAGSPMPPAFSRIHVSLEGGVMARTTAVVRHLSTPIADALASPELFPTLPYALEEGNAYRVGAVLMNGAEETVVNRFRIEIPGGYDLTHNGTGGGAGLFASPLAGGTAVARQWSDPPLVSATNSEWRVVGPRLIEWTGNLKLSAHAVAAFQVDASIGDAPTAFDAGQSGYWNSTLRFDGNGFVADSFDGPGAWRTAPGVARFRVPPATPTQPGAGYFTPGVGEPPDATFDARHHWAPKPDFVAPRRPALSYSVGVSPNVDAILSGTRLARVEASPRVAAGGDSVTIHVDFSGLVTTLSDLGSSVQDVVLETNVYAPPSLPSTPLVRMRESLVTDAFASVLDLGAAELDAGAVDHAEIVAATGDGSVYAFDVGAAAATPLMEPGAPPSASLWSARTVVAARADARQVLTGVLRPGGPQEVAVQATDGTVTMLGASGLERWQRALGGVGLTLAADRETSDGRIIAVRSEARAPIVNLMRATDGATIPLTRPGGDPNPLATSRTIGASATAFATSSARAFVVAVDGGRAAAWAADGAFLWSYPPEGVTPVSGYVHAIGRGAFTAPAYAGSAGEEVVVVWSSTVVVLNGETGAELRRIEVRARDDEGVLRPRSVHIADVSASILGSPAPEVLLAVNDKQVVLMNVDLNEPATTFSNYVFVSGAGRVDPDPLELKPGMAVWQCIPDHEWDYCPDPVVADEGAIEPTAVRLVPAGAGGYAIVAGSLGVSEYVTAIQGGGPPVSWVPAPKRLPQGWGAVVAVAGIRQAHSADAPFIALGTLQGQVFLLNWNSGLSLWTANYAPGEAGGEVTYGLTFPRASFPGTYVVHARLTWKQFQSGLSGPLIAQEANIVNWFELLDADGRPLTGAFVLPVEMRAWKGDWEE